MKSLLHTILQIHWWMNNFKSLQLIQITQIKVSRGSETKRTRSQNQVYKENMMSMKLGNGIVIKSKVLKLMILLMTKHIWLSKILIQIHWVITRRIRILIRCRSMTIKNLEIRQSLWHFYLNSERKVLRILSPEISICSVRHQWNLSGSMTLQTAWLTATNRKSISIYSRNDFPKPSLKIRYNQKAILRWPKT